MPWLALMYIYMLCVLLLQQLFSNYSAYFRFMYVYTSHPIAWRWSFPCTIREGMCRCGSITLLFLELRQECNWESSFTIPSTVLWIWAKWSPALLRVLRIKGTPIFLYQKCNRASSDVHLADLPVYWQCYPTFQLSSKLRYYLCYSIDKWHHFWPNFPNIFDWNTNIIP